MKYFAIQANTNSTEYEAKSFLIELSQFAYINHICEISSRIMEEHDFEYIAFRSTGRFFEENILTRKKYKIVELDPESMNLFEPLPEMQTFFHITNYGVMFSASDNEGPAEHFTDTIPFFELNNLNF